jgi:hypothetical protein
MALVVAVEQPQGVATALAEQGALVVRVHHRPSRVHL